MDAYGEIIKSCKFKAVESYLRAQYEFKKGNYEGAFINAYISLLESVEAFSLSPGYVASSRKDLISKFQSLREVDERYRAMKGGKEDANLSLEQAKKFLRVLFPKTLFLIDCSRDKEEIEE
jgi:hypothetical protein